MTKAPLTREQFLELLGDIEDHCKGLREQAQSDGFRSDIRMLEANLMGVLSEVEYKVALMTGDQEYFELDRQRREQEEKKYREMLAAEDLD